MGREKTGWKLCSEFLVIVAMSSSFGNKNSVYLRQEVKVFLRLWGYLRACSCPAMMYGSILLSPSKLKSVHHSHWIRIQFRSLKHHLFYHSFIIVLNVIICQMQYNMKVKTGSLPVYGPLYHIEKKHCAFALMWCSQKKQLKGDTLFRNYLFLLLSYFPV